MKGEYVLFNAVTDERRIRTHTNIDTSTCIHIHRCIVYPYMHLCGLAHSTCTYIRILIHACPSTTVYMHMHMHVYVHTFACTYRHGCKYVYMHIDTNINTYTCTYTYICYLILFLPYLCPLNRSLWTSFGLDTPLVGWEDSCIISCGNNFMEKLLESSITFRNMIKIHVHILTMYVLFPNNTYYVFSSFVSSESIAVDEFRPWHPTCRMRRLVHNILWKQLHGKTSRKFHNIL
jgi:hypothetical protein